MKAIALISGGLDSFLAAKIIQNQNIEVSGVYFLMPFCKQDESGLNNPALKRTAEQLNLKLKVKYLGREYLKIVKNPKYGYGKNLNPCIDCKILMLKQARKIMKTSGAEFIVTGEVLGQRPMSQNRQSLNLIEKQSGLKGRLLRPLSAKMFEPTVAETKGWINREKLLDIKGRGRSEQIELAKQFRITEYLQPAGGCLLTDSSFCDRLKDLLEHKEYSLDNIELLKLGRHFRISPAFKLIVGRDEKENEKLLKLAKKKDIIFEPAELPGPTALGIGVMDKKTKELSARIVARYTAPNKKIKVLIKGLLEEEVIAKGKK
ncbi:MAG: tRNA 4-thiouridine(8) synthase ThiI [Candidatus Omnitrophota bacterium]